MKELKIWLAKHPEVVLLGSTMFMLSIVGVKCLVTHT